MTTTGPRRADAVRNRALILDATRELVRVHGPDVGMDQIARAAGVAVGTLYRHFPTKADLVGAVVSEFFDVVADDAEATLARVLAGAPPAGELKAFLSRVLEAGASNQVAKTAAKKLGASGENPEADARISVAVNGIIAAGRSTGDLRDDLTVLDIYLLAGTAPSEASPTVRERWLSVVTHGLFARGVTAPPGS
ncbi:MAG: helix-turn-helix domain containing protein [Chloroflexi bacterium]|nr:helix-turn-helix domain containing protein [Chloroflexota bacterium]